MDFVGYWPAFSSAGSSSAFYSVRFSSSSLTFSWPGSSLSYSSDLVPLDAELPADSGFRPIFFIAFCTLFFTDDSAEPAWQSSYFIDSTSALASAFGLAELSSAA